MNIKLDPHTLERAEERGASEFEIIDVLNNGKPVSAKKNRLAKEKVFKFEKEWLGKVYEEKIIRVIYLKEAGNIITVTVYVFYGKWSS